ncbi:MAG: hypothetical protein EBR82_53810 [Caulobacteraceae bacterium]|nr:hypothetical protein [Caulobacteraceae bacterium]
MAKSFRDLNTVEACNMNREQAMIYIIHFFNSRIMTMSKSHVNKAKELIDLHKINLSELVNRYVELVLENS